MIDHISIGVRDLARSKRFCDEVLRPLDYRCLSENAHAFGFGRESPVFWIARADRPVPPDMESGLHFCFEAATEAAVDAFHAAGLRAGGTDYDGPGLRPEYSDDYYAAFVIDPDGYRLEACTTSR